MKKKHSCEQVLLALYPGQDQANEGEQFICTCGYVYTHICNEAEGCFWTLTALRLAEKGVTPRIVKP